MREFPKWNSLPFNGAGRLRANVVNHAGHTAHFIDDAGRNAFQDFSGEADPVGGHGVIGFHDAYGDREAIGTIVAHDADATDRKQDGEGLPNFTIETGATYLFYNDGVRLLEGKEMLSGDLAEKPYGQARARKRVFQKNLIWKA